MKKLTKRLKNGTVVQLPNVDMRESFISLSAYEDTNLTPAEIEALKAEIEKAWAQLHVEIEKEKALKAENARLSRERDAAVQVIYSVPTCTNCIHMDECDEIGGRCEGRGYGGDCHEPYDEPHFKWRGIEPAESEESK